jgi:hypothetical protein
MYHRTLCRCLQSVCSSNEQRTCTAPLLYIVVAGAIVLLSHCALLAAYQAARCLGVHSSTFHILEVA